jgi:hypothetical protein
MNANGARQSAHDAGPAKENSALAIPNRGKSEQSRSSAAKLLEQPLTAVDYSEANRQADQDYDRTPDKESL